MDEKSVEELAEQIITDLTIGIKNSGVRAGIIGEIGCSWPLAKNELKVLRAAAMAQRETGAPLMIHPGRNESAPLEIIKILRDAGADLSRTIICHITRTLFDSANRLKVAEAGCYLEYDIFGRDSYYYPMSMAPIELPSDPQRVDQIRELIAEGYEKQILVSHDFCVKIQLTRYGGYGYGYILQYGVPLMRRKGMSEEQINTILIDNPKNVLRFASMK